MYSKYDDVDSHSDSVVSPALQQCPEHGGEHSNAAEDYKND